MNAYGETRHVKSCGGVLYRKENGSTLFLLLGNRKRGVWGLPKGLMEEGEDEVMTAIREVKEETGIKSLKLHGKIGAIRYQFNFRGRRHDKTVEFYLFETDVKEARVGTEHDQAAWLTVDEALRKITYPNEREILGRAKEMLQGGKQQTPA